MKKHILLLSLVLLSSLLNAQEYTNFELDNLETVIENNGDTIEVGIFTLEGTLTNQHNKNENFFPVLVDKNGNHFIQSPKVEFFDANNNFVHFNIRFYPYTAIQDFRLIKIIKVPQNRIRRLERVGYDGLRQEYIEDLLRDAVFLPYAFKIDYRKYAK